MPSTEKVTDEERREIWDYWLDGYSLSYMRSDRFEGRHSLAVLKSVLAEEPPETIREDDRYRYGGSFFWIYAEGLNSPVTGKDLAFVIARMPRRQSQAQFERALRAIEKDFASIHPEAELNTRVFEPIESRFAFRWVNERGCPGWTVHEDGTIERMVPAPSADLEPSAPAP